MKTLTAVVLTLVLAGLLVAGTSDPSSAACHAFTVEVSPTTAPEGSTVTVTVRRDGAFSPSGVDVSTADGSAKVGQDYTEFKRRVEFTNETQQTFNAAISIKDDTTYDPDETFKLVLSNAGGCAIPPNHPPFSYGQAIVTIKDNDPAPATQPPPGGTSPKASPTATGQASPTPTADGSPGSPVPLEGASPEETPTTAKEAQPTDEDDGSPTGLIVAAIGILVAAGAGFGLWFLRKTPGS